MGLDMYLQAERSFPLDSEVGQKLSAIEGEWWNDDPPGASDLAVSRDLHLSGYREEDRRREVLAIAGIDSLVTGEEHCNLVERPPIITAKATVVYWRKANSVHGWFVKNVQEGVDECYTYEVHPEQLAALVRDCEEALHHYYNGDRAGAAAVMMPTRGCCFGSYDIDEWWVKDLTDTVTEVKDAISRIVALHLPDIIITYHSSW